MIGRRGFFAALAGLVTLPWLKPAPVIAPLIDESHVWLGANPWLSNGDTCVVLCDVTYSSSRPQTVVYQLAPRSSTVTYSHNGRIYGA